MFRGRALAPNPRKFGKLLGDDVQCPRLCDRSIGAGE
jgi:hypothetical protein